MHKRMDKNWDPPTISCERSFAFQPMSTYSFGACDCVEFHGYYSLRILGTLIACGAPKDTIVFTTNQPEKYYPLTDSSKEGGWLGIVFDNGVDGANGNMDDNDSSMIDYCRIEYTKGFGDSGYLSITGSVMVGYFGKLRISNYRGCLAKPTTISRGILIHHNAERAVGLPSGEKLLQPL